MDRTTPIVLVPGLASSARIYAPVMPALWRFGPVMVGNHIRDDSMSTIAARGTRQVQWARASTVGTGPASMRASTASHTEAMTGQSGARRAEFFVADLRRGFELAQVCHAGLLILRASR